MLEAAVDDRTQQLRLEQEVAEAGRVDAHVAPLVAGADRRGSTRRRGGRGRGSPSGAKKKRLQRGDLSARWAAGAARGGTRASGVRHAVTERYFEGRVGQKRARRAPPSRVARQSARTLGRRRPRSSAPFRAREARAPPCGADALLHGVIARRLVVRGGGLLLLLVVDELCSRRAHRERGGSTSEVAPGGWVGVAPRKQPHAPSSPSATGSSTSAMMFEARAGGGLKGGGGCCDRRG